MLSENVKSDDSIDHDDDHHEHEELAFSVPHVHINPSGLLDVYVDQ